MILGQCIWRIFFPRVRAWEPACLKCGYNLKGLSSDSCPECGKDFDLKTYDTLNPGIFVYAWIVWRVTLICFAALNLFDFAVSSVLIPYINGTFKPIEHMGYPFHIFYATGTTHFSNWSWHWDALMDNIALCLLIGCVIGLLLISRKMRKRDLMPSANDD